MANCASIDQDQLKTVLVSQVVINMNENKNNINSNWEIIEDAKKQRKQALLNEIQNSKRKDHLSDEAWQIFTQVREWGKKHWNNGIKEDSKIYFEIITKRTSEKKQICIKPIFRVEDDDILIQEIQKPVGYKGLLFDLDIWFYYSNGDKKPIENLDFKINDDFLSIKADISDKYKGERKKVKGQNQEVTESFYPSLIEDIKRERKEFGDQIYTSILDIEAKENLKVLIYIEREKDDPNYGKKIWGEFVIVVIKPGQRIRLTKSEYEMNKMRTPDFEKITIPHSVHPNAAA